MRASIFPILLLLVAFSLPSSGAQRRRPQKPTQAQPSVLPPAYDRKPFNIRADNLPPKYLGVPFIELYNGLLARQAASLKGEFESTNDYNLRKAKLDKVPLVGSINIDSYVAFLIDNEESQLTTKYDADLNSLNVKLTWQSASFPWDHDYNEQSITLSWLSTSKTIGSYIGHNAFNRSVRVTVYRNDDYLVATKLSALRGFVGFNDGIIDYSIQSSFDIPPDEARIVKAHIRALLIGHFASDLIHSDREHDTPEISDPYDRYNFTHVVKIIPEQVWFYDIQTGKVYLKLQ